MLQLLVCTGKNSLGFKIKQKYFKTFENKLYDIHKINQMGTKKHDRFVINIQIENKSIPIEFNRGAALSSIASSGSSNN